MKLPDLTARLPDDLSDRLTTLRQSAATQQLQHQATAQALRLISRLPDAVLSAMVTLIAPKQRFDSADPLMQLMMAVNNIDPNRGMITEDIIASRQRFHDSVTALQGKKPRIRSVRDLSFDNRDGQSIPLRHYQPLAPTLNSPSQSSTDLPLVVFFHGGGFAIGDIETHDEFCHYLCHYAGFPVLSVGYRLAPEHPAPAAIHDCLDAVIWVSSHLDDLAMSSGKIIVAGDSAGGNLAAVISQQLARSTEFTHACPVMQWLLYPVTDNEGEYPSHHAYDTGTLLSLRDRSLFKRFYSDQSDIDLLDPLVSPMHGDLTELPPAFVAVSELDILSDEGEAYARKLKENGNTVTFEKVRGMPHGFLNIISIHAQARRATIELIQAMRRFYFDHVSPGS